MGRNLDDVLRARERSGSPYSYRAFTDNDGHGRVLATHPEDGVVGGLAWDAYDGQVDGIYVAPKHRNTSVALGMLRFAHHWSNKTGAVWIPSVTEGATYTQHGYGLMRGAGQDMDPSPDVQKVTPETEKSIVETNLEKYANPNWSIKWQEYINDDI